MSFLRHTSLATRLGLLFAVLAALIFSIAGSHLYQSISRELQWRENAALLNTIDYLRHQLEETKEISAAREDLHRLLDVVLGQQGMLLALRDSKGNLLATTAGNYALLPTDTPVAADRSPEVADIRVWRGGGGKRGRVISAWARIGHQPDNSILLIVARDDQEEEAVLSAYRKDLLWTVLAGALATALFGYIIARRGLQPLRVVAKMAGVVTANQLGERLRVEDVPSEIKEMALAFNLMLDRLEDSFRRLSQFSSDIAHDLRTPISNLMVETQVTLSQRRSVQAYEELLISNVEEYERLTRMMENMLFLAHADNAQVMLRKETLACEAELRRIAEYFEGMADEAGVSLVVDASGSLVADAILFRRAVSNLVANAIRYTTSGERIILRGYPRDDSEFIIEVSNPGVGIPPEHLSRIFDRFYRIDTSRVKSQTSSGLGLAIVKSIAALHGGSVQVESVLNGLTTFRFILSAR